MKNYQVKVSIDDELRVWLLARAEESGSSLSQAAREILHRTMKAEAPAPALPRKFDLRAFFWLLEAAGVDGSSNPSGTVSLTPICYAELWAWLVARKPRPSEPLSLAGFTVEIDGTLAPNTARVDDLLIDLPK